MGDHPLEVDRHHRLALEEVNHRLADHQAADHLEANLLERLIPRHLGDHLEVDRLGVVHLGAKLRVKNSETFSFIVYSREGNKMHTIQVGPLSLSLQRTVRVSNNNEASNLPPSLGVFEVYKVSEFAESCPKSWDREGYFIAMHSQEAMWMSFQNCEPVAIMIGAGAINAVNGNKYETKLEQGGYLVAPPQPWLDGWKGDDGTVYQFIATEVGENKTVGEQLSETKEHAILVSTFIAKNPEKLQSSRIRQTWGNSEFGECDYESIGCCKALCSFGTEMGLGKGGKIKQKIYEDPHGIEEWVDKPEKTVKIYLINASEFAEITGQILPPPVTAEQYNGIWFGLEDEALKSVPGNPIFDKLKSAI